MFSDNFKMTRGVITAALMLIFSIGLSACDGAKPPELMKAVKQFDSDATRDEHVKNMRLNHMDELLHKRDETVIKGVRTKKHSLKACINCHVPETHKGEVLRHTNPEHFCSTCHNYVAQKIDCFDCHMDHPMSDKSAKAPNDSVHNSSFVLNSNNIDTIAINTKTDSVVGSNKVDAKPKTGESTSE